jgi:hypothetical protein
MGLHCAYYSDGYIKLLKNIITGRHKKNLHAARHQQNQNEDMSLKKTFQH